MIPMKTKDNFTSEDACENSASFYDMDHNEDFEDIPFYLEYAKNQNGEILELGCGTGRVALLLAEAGFNVTGIDISKQMIDIFMKKLSIQDSILGSVTLIKENMACFDVGKKFSMIIAPFRAFQTLINEDDIKNSLFCIMNHLNDDGIFIVNVLNPCLRMGENWCYDEKTRWEKVDELGNTIIKKEGGDKIDTLNQITYRHYIFEITYKNGNREQFRAESVSKYYYRDQLKKLIESAGMEIIESYSWYDKTPLNRFGREIIYVCKKH